jgi:hypothetical protein
MSMSRSIIFWACSSVMCILLNGYRVTRSVL